jgi:formamidopyrimidine-DNA glycosylase
MLEIPEAVVISGQMREKLAGRRVESAVAGASPHGFAWYFGDPTGYSDLLVGRVVKDARAVGGMVEIILDGARIVLCDGASPRYFAPGAKRPPKHQLLVEFDDSSALACGVQMYGGIWAFREGEFENGYYETAQRKPSPLADDFTYDFFREIASSADGKLSAKALLATEQRIPGLGNGALQDILFRANIHPKRKVSTLTENDIKKLYESVVHTLRAMTEAGGRDVEKDFFGNPGGYKTILSRLTVGAPCPVCGRTIVKEAYLGGAVYYCPGCQPATAQ